MANNDSAQYTLRFNEITGNLEYGSGNNWTSTGITSTEGINQLTGDVTAGPGTGSQAATVASVGGSSAAAVHTAVGQAAAALPSASFTDTAVTSKLLTGYSSGAGTIAATDTILQGINKLNGNTAGKATAGAVGSSGLTQNTARLLGRTTASAGAVEEITVGSGLSLSAGSLSATGGSGPTPNYATAQDNGNYTIAADNTAHAVSSTTITLTPSSNTAAIRVSVVITIGSDTNGNEIWVELQDNGTPLGDDFALAISNGLASTQEITVSPEFIYVPGNTSAHTYRCAVRAFGSGNVLVNNNGHTPMTLSAIEIH
jgi:hypothetical protein